MIKTEKSISFYVFSIRNGKTIKLEKEIVDRYSGLICPVDEEFILYMIRTCGKNSRDEDVLSYRIALSMVEELSGKWLSQDEI